MSSYSSERALNELGQNMSVRFDKLYRYLFWWFIYKIEKKKYEVMIFIKFSRYFINKIKNKKLARIILSFAL